MFLDFFIKRENENRGSGVGVYCPYTLLMVIANGIGKSCKIPVYEEIWKMKEEQR